MAVAVLSGLHLKRELCLWWDSIRGGGGSPTRACFTEKMCSFSEVHLAGWYSSIWMMWCFPTGRLLPTMPGGSPRWPSRAVLRFRRYATSIRSRPCCIRAALTAKGFVSNLNFKLWK